MVAFDSQLPAKPRLDLESTAPFPSRGGAGRPWIERDSLGRIREIRIAGWRILQSSAERSIAEVRPFSDGRTAVLFELRQQAAGPVIVEMWQMYDAGGRLTAAAHYNSDGSGALLTNYLTREACRLAPDAAGALETVASWRF